MTERSRAGTFVLGLVLVAALAACGDDGNGSAAPQGDASADRTYAADVMNDYPLTSSVRTYDTFAESMPNYTYKHGDRTIRLSEIAVLGRVTKVDKGRGFTATENAESGTATSYDDPKSAWRTIHLQVAVDERIVGKVDGDVISVGLAVRNQDVDFERLAAGLTSYEQVVLPLKRDRSVFGYDKSLWAVADSGRLFGVASASDEVTLPFIESSEEATRLLRGSSTVTAVTESAKSRDVVLARSGLR